MTASPRKTAPTPAKTAALAALAMQVDELGAIDKTLAPLRALISRETILRDAIRHHYDLSPAAEPFEARGEKFVVLVGGRGAKTIVDYAKLIKRMGLAAFAKIATVTLGALEKEVTCGVYAEVTSVKAEGPRSLKIFERGVN